MDVPPRLLQIPLGSQNTTRPILSCLRHYLTSFRTAGFTRAHPIADRPWVPPRTYRLSISHHRGRCLPMATGRKPSLCGPAFPYRGVEPRIPLWETMHHPKLISLTPARRLLSDRKPGVSPEAWTCVLQPVSRLAGKPWGPSLSTGCPV